jgi:hypothetical protein
LCDDGGMIACRKSMLASCACLPSTNEQHVPALQVRCVCVGGVLLMMWADSLQEEHGCVLCLSTMRLKAARACTAE